MNLYIFLLLLLLAFSCSPVYQPSSVVAPLLEEKGNLEVQITARMGNMATEFSSWPISGATINTGIAYAMSNKYAGMVNFEYQDEYYKNNPNIFSEHNTRDGYLAELFFGRYFFKPGLSNTALFLGAGKGFRDLSFEQYSFSSSYGFATYQTDYFKTSLLFQHSIRDKWAKEKEKLILTLFMRLSFVHNYNTNLVSSNNYYLMEFSRYKNFYTCEPGLNLSFQFGRCAFFLQGNYSLYPGEIGRFEYATMGFVSLGARVKIR